MKYGKILLASAISFTIHSLEGIPEWNFLSYMQADNNLCEFAAGNIDGMKAVGSTRDLNILVQMDVPQDRITHRLRLLQGGKENDDSDPDHEMGYHPEEEILTSIQDWVYKKYPAKRLCLNLWNHGGGAVDQEATRSLIIKHNKSHRIGLFARTAEKNHATRGILFDDSQGTFLSTADLGDACAKITDIIGHKIDILGMDACLMAMIEDAYEFHGSVDCLVASEQTIPGTGWPYQNILQTLADTPKMTNKAFAASIVDAYAECYTKKETTDFTLSAIDVTRIAHATDAFNIFLDAIRAAFKVNPSGTASFFNTARKNTLVIDRDFAYVDLVDFYEKIIAQISRQSKFLCIPKRMTPAVAAVKDAAENAKAAALSAIIHAAAGAAYSGRAHGMSIYFPSNGRIEKLYRTTNFAKDTGWPEVLEAMSHRR